MYYLTDVKECGKIAGLYEPFALRTKASNEELLQLLRREHASLRDAHPFDQWNAILQGRLGRDLIVPGPRVWNKVLTGYLKDTEGARLCNEHTSNEDGVLRYLAVGTGNVDPADDDAQLLREIYRAAPLSKKNTDSGSKFILQLDFGDANPGVATTVTAGSWSTLTFEVASTTGFAVGDAISVGTTPATSYSRIAAITPGTPGSITVDSLEPLLSIPAPGQAVTLLIGSAGAFGNGLASGTINTGTMFSHSKLRIPKDSDLAWFIRFTFLRTAV